MAEPLAAGDVVAWRYAIERPLGAGGAGTTYLARDLRSDQRVALKVVPPRAVEVLKGEFAQLRGLYHPTLQRVVDFALLPAGAALASTYVEGVPLSSAPIDSWAQLRALVADVLAALSFLHDLGVVHGDVKPDNVLVGARAPLRETGGRRSDRATLIDLSCARLAGGEGGPIAGTPGFMPPESGSSPVAPSADLFALGRTIDLTIARAGLVADVPAPARRWIARARSPAIEERPRTARELAEALGLRLPAHPLRSLVRSALVGRRAMLTDLEAWIEGLAARAPGLGPLHLHGPRGVGKSRLLAEARWHAQTRLRVFDASGPHAPGVLAALVGQALRRAPSPLDARALADAVALLAALPPALFVVDDAAALPLPDRRSLVALARLLEDTPGVGLLTADEALLPPLEPRPVPPLARAEIADWIGRLAPHLRAGEIHEATGGLPGEIVHLLAGAPERSTPWARGVRARESALVALATSSPWPLPLAVLGDLADPRGRDRRAALAALVAAGTLAAAPGPDEAFTLARESERASLAARFSRILPRVHRLLLRRVRAGGAVDRARELGHVAGAGEDITAYVQASLAGPLDPLLPLLRAPWVASAGEAGRVLHAALTEASGDWRATLEVVARARATLRAGGEASRRLRLCAARAYARLGDRRAVPALARALREAPRDDRCAVAGALALALLKRGAYRDAGRVAAEALETATGRDRVELLVTAAQAASYDGATGEADALLADAEAQPEEARGGSTGPRLHHAAGILALRRGDPAAAARAFSAAVASSHSRGLPELFASASLSLGALRHQSGDWAAAAAAYEAAERTSVALGFVAQRATVAFNLARLACDIGRFAAARQAIERAEGLAEETSNRFLVAACASLRAEVSSLEGDDAAARQAYGAAREGFSRLGATRERAEVELALAAHCLRVGDRAEAHVTLRALAPALGALPSPGSMRGDSDELAVAYDLAFAALAAAHDERLRTLMRALGHAERTGQAALVARVRTALAAAYRERGLDALAADERRAARATWERILAALPADGAFGRLLGAGPEVWRAFVAHPDRRALFAEAVEPPVVAPADPSPRAPHAEPSLRHLKKLLEVNQRLLSAATTREIVEAAVDAAIELAGAEHGLVIVRGEGEASLHVARSAGGRDAEAREARFSQGLAKRVIDSGEPVLSLDAGNDPRLRRRRSVHALRLKSVLAVPVRDREQVVAVLSLHSNVGAGRFTPDDVAVVTSFADQVALALGRARLVDELAERARALEKAKLENEALLVAQAAQIVQLEGREVPETRSVAAERFPGIIGASPALRRVLDVVARVADADIPVLIRGETGTGKERIARATHEHSRRAAAPFVAINCAALPEALLEAELFGYVKGAFTGAVHDKAGLFVAADGGTLFLDEVGEMPASLQVKLLRALQEREITPLGATRPRHVDARIVSATHRALREMVAEKRFREDLYYRLAVVELELPPLRDRTEDIPAIAARIMSRLAKTSGRPPKAIAPSAMRQLLRARWPGNVRELENVLARAFYLTEGPAIDAFELPAHAPAAAPPVAAQDAPRPRGYRPDDAARMREALVMCGWNVSEAARSLSVSRATFYRRMVRYGLEPPARGPRG